MLRRQPHVRVHLDLFVVVWVPRQRGSSQLGLGQNLRVKRFLAQRAIIVIRTPLFDALRVEVVALVAGQGRDLVRALERQQADDALLVLAELRPVEHARKLPQVRARRLPLEPVVLAVRRLAFVVTGDCGRSRS